MTKKVRVRFAPSPTGPLHIGGVRTALFNFLFAKKHQGDFILRIEDTDQNRYVKGAEQYIIDALNWCNIQYDEGPLKEGKYGPYRQSERKNLYKKYATSLITKGHAYYAFDTNEALDQERKKYEEQGETFIYNYHNRLKLDNSLNLSQAEIEKKLKEGINYVIRFKTPENEELKLNDLIRGAVKIQTNTLDDKVLYKSDGMPTYHLANVVDDHLMEITHVIRGEEWLPSLGLHHQLYTAFGWEAPQFAHLPLIMKPVGKGKLSKRDGAKLGFPVFPLTWEESIGYKEEGYFPEAVTNFLALLGWNPGTEKEIFTLNELINAFNLDRVNKSGARFDPNKTKWYNQAYMQQKDAIELAAEFIKHLEKEEIKIPSSKNNTAYVSQVISLIKERAVFIKDFWELGKYFFEAPKEYDEKAVKKQWKEETISIMKDLILIIENIEVFTSENIENKVKNWIEEKELSFGKVMPPLRLVIVGEMKGPHIFDIMAMIGKTDCINRINNAIEVL